MLGYIPRCVLQLLLMCQLCSGLVFTSTPNATSETCDGGDFTFNWVYASGTPTSITWKKKNNDGTLNATLAAFSLGMFAPAPAYGTRVTQVGNNGAIKLSGTTAADNGVYQIELVDLTTTLRGNTTLSSFAVNGPINASCVENPANVYTVTCSVDVTPPVTLQLKNGTVELDSASSASGLSKTLSDAHNQTFQCSVTGEGSECVTPNSTDVTCISDGPYQISLTPSTSSYTVTEHQALPPITCSALCRPGCSYRWLHNGTAFSSGATLSLGQADRSKTGSYMCQPSNTHGSGDSVTVSIDVQYGPYQISLTPSTSSYTVTEHQALPLITCSALCRPGCTYRWLHNGTAFSSEATLSLGQTDRSKTGSYRCQPSNTHGSGDSVTVSIDVQYPAEVVLETEGSATCRPHRVYVGQQNVQLTCRVTAANPAVTSYTWTHNSSVIQSARGAVFTISSVSRTSGGSYTCQGSNSLSGFRSSPVTLEVQYPPSVSVPNSQTVNETQTLTPNLQQL